MRAASALSRLTGWIVSPVMPSASRLVASTRSRGQAASSSCTSSAVSAITCSQLSMSSSTGRSASAVVRRSTMSPVGAAENTPASRSPQSGDDGVRDLVVLGSAARSTKQISPSRVPAASTASRVLPAPPGPSSVTSRHVPSRAAT
ncbi:hypothetical protein [Kutzneria kofuensis]|uniref:hypothetical protein n=1 Tax=Kutzneria kofuensis TaxID=103725 RepID=UPI0031EFDFCE